MLADHAQERIAIGFQFARANTADFTQRGKGGGADFRHFAQGGIVEDDIGRHARVLSQIAA